MFKMVFAKIIAAMVVLIVSSFVLIIYTRSQGNNYLSHSNGLGLSRGEWEGIYGKARKEDSAQAIYRDEKRRFIVSFWNGNVGYIDVKPNDLDVMTLDSARSESRKYFPIDSEFIGTYNSGSGPAYDIYYSESLKNCFPTDFWIGGKPGDFIVEYFPNANSVEYFVIGIGKNP
jgi:hypothetical protein